jgi:hypothetical protein
MDDLALLPDKAGIGDLDPLPGFKNRSGKPEGLRDRLGMEKIVESLAAPRHTVTRAKRGETFICTHDAVGIDDRHRYR